MGDIVLEPITGTECSPPTSPASPEKSYDPPPATTTATDVAMGTKAGPDEDIQDLLEDIRGSFERQFDDGFNGVAQQVSKEKFDGGRRVKNYG